MSAEGLLEESVGQLRHRNRETAAGETDLEGGNERSGFLDKQGKRRWKPRCSIREDAERFEGDLRSL